MIDRADYPTALHWAFDNQYCLPPSKTGQYYRVERWRGSYPYVATFDNRADATRLASALSRLDRHDARVIKLNV
jgi:hypothetical protein